MTACRSTIRTTTSMTSIPSGNPASLRATGCWTSLTKPSQPRSMVRPFRRSPTRVYRPTHVLRPFIQMNDPSATGCGSRRLAASTLGSRAPVASAHHIPRLVFSLPFAAAADLRNLCCRDRCTGGVECGVAGHISPALEANEADIHTAYRWGPSQSHMATANPDSPLPIFLAFQPYVRSTPCPVYLPRCANCPGARRWGGRRSGSGGRATPGRWSWGWAGSRSLAAWRFGAQLLAAQGRPS